MKSKRLIVGSVVAVVAVVAGIGVFVNVSEAKEPSPSARFAAVDSAVSSAEGPEVGPVVGEGRPVVSAAQAATVGPTEDGDGPIVVAPAPTAAAAASAIAPAPMPYDPSQPSAPQAPDTKDVTKKTTMFIDSATPSGEGMINLDGFEATYVPDAGEGHFDKGHAVTVTIPAATRVHVLDTNTQVDAHDIKAGDLAAHLESDTSGKLFSVVSENNFVLSLEELYRA